VNDTCVVDSAYGPFVAFADDIITDQLVRFGAHAGGELGMVLSLLRPGDTVIDVGAHVGTFSVPIGRAIGPTGRLVCFEPAPESHRLLEMNIEMNGLTATTITRAMAVGDHDALYRAVAASDHNTGGTYLEPSDDPDAIAGTTLDAWLLRNADIAELDLLKVDTEGMELMVLRGASNTLAERSPIVYAEVAAEQLGRFEASPRDLEDLLRELGYDFYRNMGHRHGRHREASLAELETLESDELFDVIAVPRSRMGRLVEAGLVE
jgi:FkbM family methyltransferase